MNQIPFTPQERDPRRAAESGSVGYNRETDDELHDLELTEGRINPSSQRGAGAGGPGGMMPPMMGMMGRGGGAGAGAGAGGAGAMNAGVLGATAGRAGNVPMGASGAGAGGFGAGSVGAGGVGAGGVGAGGIGGVGGIGNFPRTGGTIAAGASGSGYSPYGINPATGEPWKPSDPGYPPVSGVSPITSWQPPQTTIPSPKPFDPPSPIHGITPAPTPPINSVPTRPIDGLQSPKQPTVPPIKSPAPGELSPVKPTDPLGPPENPIDGANPVQPPKVEAPSIPNPTAGVPNISGPSISGPSIGGPSISGPGTGSVSPGGGDDDSYAVDPAELAKTGKLWDELAERMRAVNEKVQKLSVAAAQFGLVIDPEPNYSAAHQQAGVAAQAAAQDFTDNNEKLNSSSRAFEAAEDANTQTAANSMNGGSAGPSTATANVAQPY